MKQSVVIVDTEMAASATGANAGALSLASLTDLGARVIVCSPSASSKAISGDQVVIVLVITTAAAGSIRAARASLPSTPILALLSDVSAGPPVRLRDLIEAGADYILGPDASGELLAGVYLAAERAGKERMRTLALESALQSVSDSVELGDADTSLLFVNAAFEKMTGYERAEVMGKTPRDLLRSDVHDAHFYGEMWNVVSSGRQWSGSLVGRRKNGALVSQLATVKPISDDSGTVRHFVAIKQFVPENLDAGPPPTDAAALAEHVHASIAALTNSERRYRMLVEGAGDAIMIVDFDTAKVIEVNAAAIAMFGYEPAELRLLTPRQLAGPDASAIVDRMAKSITETGRAFESRHPMRRKDGSCFFAAVHLTTYDFLGHRQYMGVIRDVTAELERSNRQLAEAQAQLLQSSRLAALGHMAAGVAHEINNPLQYIFAGIDEMDPIAANDPERQQIVADMRLGAERIRSITHSLLPFARVEGPQQMELVNLNELVDWSARLVGNELRHRAQLELRLSPSLPRILGHRTRIGEVVTNLLTNAANAIEEGASDQHRITVVTEATSDNRHVRLIVEDTGRGIPEELRARVFDPFFTMRPDEAAGLGLALCAEIVARHDGTIELESNVGVGSRFIVTLSTETEKRTPPPSQMTTPVATSATTAPAQRATRVLVIDDDEALMRTYQRSLKGLDVVTALGGRAALDILATDVDFDAILCDLMMPSVDGPMVYAFIQVVAPTLASRTLFCSGGAFTPRVRAFLESIPNLVLDKPVGAAQLRAALVKVATHRR